MCNYVSPPWFHSFSSSPIGHIVDILHLISKITLNSVHFLVSLDDELNDQSETGRKKNKRKTTPRNVSKSLVLLISIFSSSGA